MARGGGDDGGDVADGSAPGAELEDPQLTGMNEQQDEKTEKLEGTNEQQNEITNSRTLRRLRRNQKITK